MGKLLACMCCKIAVVFFFCVSFVSSFLVMFSHLIVMVL